MPTLLMKAEVQGREINFEWDLESWLHDKDGMRESIAEKLEVNVDSIDSYEVIGAGKNWHDLEPYVSGFSSDELETLKHVYKSVYSEEEWIAYQALVYNANGHIFDYDDFHDSYCGQVESFDKFAMGLVDEVLLCDGDDNSLLRNYFDYDRFAIDLRHNYTVLDAKDWGVFVFRDW